MFKALIQKFLIGRRKQANVQASVTGFTLIELLVSIIIASIIVGTLFGFLISILERDRTEQAKVDAQDESQSALNFIANDITQAVYIYDSDGLYVIGADNKNIASQLPHIFNGGSGCNAANCSPVLVFWKVFRYDKDDLVKGGDGSAGKNRNIRCLDEPNDIAATCIGGNKYTYSLVAYYLLKDSNPNWSSASRIVRWELKDGILWSCQDTSTAAQTLANRCPIAGNQRVTVNNIVYAVKPDPGFVRFDLSGSGTLAQRMNRWRPDTVNYNLAINTFDELLDYVDDTPYSILQDNGIIGDSPTGARVDINITKNIPGNFSVIPPIPSKNLTCDNPDTGVGVGLDATQLGTPAQTVFAQRIPADFASGYTIYGSPVNPKGLTGFYACVNADRVSARVYIRSNALARQKDNPNSRLVSDSVFDSFLPTTSVRVFGRGVLSVD